MTHDGNVPGSLRSHFFFQAEDGIRVYKVTGVQTCALPIFARALAQLARKEQFLEVVDQAEATARFHRHLSLRPLGPETVPLSGALGRVLAEPLEIGRASCRERV